MNSELKEMSMKVMFTAIGLVMSLGACSYIGSKFGLSDDNVFEETAEFIMLDQFGVEIDLSPDSVEQ